MFTAKPISLQAFNNTSAFFPVGLPVKNLESTPSSILATFPAHLNLLDLIALTILGERYKLRKILRIVNTFKNPAFNTVRELLVVTSPVIHLRQRIRLQMQCLADVKWIFVFKHS